MADIQDRFHKPKTSYKEMFCPRCGKTDRCGMFGKKHYSGGSLCTGVPIALVYRLDTPIDTTPAPPTDTTEEP